MDNDGKAWKRGPKPKAAPIYSWMDSRCHWWFIKMQQHWIRWKLQDHETNIHKDSSPSKLGSTKMILKNGARRKDNKAAISLVARRSTEFGYLSKWRGKAILAQVIGFHSIENVNRYFNRLFNYLQSHAKHYDAISGVKLSHFQITMETWSWASIG